MRLPVARSLALSLVVSFSTLAAQTAFAETLQATRFDAIETGHRVDVRIARGSARLVVTRTVQNTGDKSDQALWMITPPPKGVAVGLRTSALAAKTGRLTWFDGELMEAEAAARKYRELTGIGGFYPKDPALLSWRSAEMLALQVFPVPGRGDKTIEYTMVAPTTYERGAHVLELPPEPREGTIPPTLHVSSADPGSEVFLNGARLASDTRVVFDGDKELRFELRPKKADALEGHVASIAVGSNRAVSHVRFFTAAKLSRVPDRAAVAIVIDASRSMESRLSASLAAARSFVSHFPSAEVDVVTFDRKVTRKTPAPVAPREAMALLHHLGDHTANGSRVDDALTFADGLLEGRSATERRILVLTDVLTRESLTPARLAARTLKSGAIVHMAVVTDGNEPTLTRDDEDPWARVATQTGGVFWEAGHPAHVDARTKSTFEEWVRPVRLDDVNVLGATADTDWPTTLAEGEGFEDWSIARFGLSAVTVRGRLWSMPFSARLLPNDKTTKLSAGLVFGSDLLASLSEPEMMILAKKGGAVSPVTSYLAIEPGVRPSTEGLDWGMGLSGVGMGAGGRGSGIGLGRAGTLGPDKRRFLTSALASAAASCHAKGELGATFETTLAEVVEISAVEQRQRDAAVESCVREALWAVTLPSTFAERFEKFSVVAKL